MAALAEPAGTRRSTSHVISPNRLLVALLALTIALPLAAAPVAAADPAGAPLPAELSHPSAQAEMLALHANDRVAAAPSASGSVESLGTDTAPLATVASAYSGPAGALPNGLRREVLGFLPYWYLTPSKLAALRYDLVSTIAYFSVGAQSNGYLLRGTSSNPAIGWTSWNSSAMTGVINAAHARGVRVVPTITMMAWDYDFTGMTQLLTSSTYRTRLVGEIVKMVADRRADGVNIDFEPVPSSLRAAFTAFVRQVKAGLVNAHLPSYVTVDTSAGAAAWSTGYDVLGLTAPGAANALMVMAYDLNWSGSSRAGGVAPIDSPYAYDVRQAMTDYLALGAPPGKLIWGVPYYGRAWNTADGSLNAVVRSPASSTAFIYYGTDADGPYGGKVLGQTYGRKWDATGQGAWVAWQASDGWREAYYDDPASLGVKYRMVSGRAMAGIGIWSLGMDAGTNDLSNVIYDRFVKLDVRLAGSNRYATAAAVSRSSFGAGRRGRLRRERRGLRRRAGRRPGRRARKGPGAAHRARQPALRNRHRARAPRAAADRGPWWYGGRVRRCAPRPWQVHDRRRDASGGHESLRHRGGDQLGLPGRREDGLRLERAGLRRRALRGRLGRQAVRADAADHQPLDGAAGDARRARAP